MSAFIYVVLASSPLSPVCPQRAAGLEAPLSNCRSAALTSLQVGGAFLLDLGRGLVDIGSPKILDFRKGADWSDQRCWPASRFNLVQRSLGGFGGKGKSSRSNQAPSGTTDVIRHAQASCPTIAMNAGEFERANQ